jgi:tetratricopeptide (TPR) repeat protein
LTPEYAEARATLGKSLEKKGELDQAIAECRKAIKIEPSYLRAYYYLGQALRKKGEPKQAAAEFRKALEVKRENPIREPLRGATVRNPREVVNTYLDLGKALKQLGDEEGARTAFRKAISLEPKSATAHFCLALVSDRDEAIALYRIAIHLKPNYADAHNNLGNALKDKKLLDQAIAAYRKAIDSRAAFEDRSGLAYAHNNLGVVHFLKGELDQAIDCYNKAILLHATVANKQTVAQHHVNLGRARLKKKDLDGAIAALSEAIKHQPDFAAAYHDLGHAHYLKRDLDKAISACREAACLRPRDARYHYNLGNVLAEKGALDEAIAAFQKAIELKPAEAEVEAEAHCNLGRALLEKGHFLLALESFRRAHELGSKKADRWVEECQRLAAFEAKLEKLKQGEGRPGEKVVEAKLTTDDAPDSAGPKRRHQVHTLPLEAGKLYRIDLASPDFDTFLRLEDSQGKQLDSNNDTSPMDPNSRLVVTPGKTGKYRLIVTSVQGAETGRYYLGVSERAPAGKPQVFAGALDKAGPLLWGRPHGSHPLKLRAGQVYLVDLESKDFTPLLLVLSSDGKVVQRSRKSGEPGKARVTISVRTDRLAELVVGAAQPGDTGSYTLRVQAHAAPGDPAPLGAGPRKQ